MSQHKAGHQLFAGNISVLWCHCKDSERENSSTAVTNLLHTVESVLLTLSPRHPRLSFIRGEQTTVTNMYSQKYTVGHQTPGRGFTVVTIPTSKLTESNHGTLTASPVPISIDSRSQWL